MQIVSSKANPPIKYCNTYKLSDRIVNYQQLPSCITMNESFSCEMTPFSRGKYRIQKTKEQQTMYIPPKNINR